MDGQLPQHILEFFERTTRTIDDRYLPAWLIADFSAPLWRVDTNAGDLREVRGEVKGGVELNWALRFPGSRFTEQAYAVPLKQVKLILISGIDCCSTGPGLSPLSIRHWHRFLMWLSEHLAVKYEGRFRRQGVRIAGLDDVGEFLDALSAAGVAGTGLYIERWQRFLSGNCGDVDPSSKAVQSFLSAVGAYNSLGELQSDYVANAIEVDPRRVRLSSHMREYLLQYGPRRSKGSPLELPFGVPTANAVRSFATLSQVLLNSVEGLAGCELADVRGVAERCKPFKGRQSRRTRTLPASVGNRLVLGCCRWMIDTAPELETFVAKACAKAKELSKEFPDHNPTRRLWEAEQQVSLPSALNPVRELGPRVLRNRSEDPYKYSVKYPVCLAAIRLHMAVCFSTIALLACSRRGEVLDLEKGAVFARRDRCYLSVMLRKRGVHGIRLSMDKPVPRLVAQCLDSLSRIEQSLATVLGRDDPLSAKRVFFKANVGGLSPLTKDDVGPGLAALSKFFGLTGNDGKAWRLKPHQLRRYFAMTFFHSGGAEDVLPALAWFMGHEDISSIWRYVREEMTGREISEAEAAMATAALFSSDESDGVARLRRIVLEHFGCDEMSVMNESDTHDYLEMLAERGAFTAQPIQLGAGRRLVYTILISISEDRLHAAID